MIKTCAYALGSGPKGFTRNNPGFSPGATKVFHSYDNLYNCEPYRREGGVIYPINFINCCYLHIDKIYL